MGAGYETSPVAVDGIRLCGYCASDLRTNGWTWVEGRGTPMFLVLQDSKVLAYQTSYQWRDKFLLEWTQEEESTRASAQKMLDRLPSTGVRVDQIQRSLGTYGEPESDSSDHGAGVLGQSKGAGSGHHRVRHPPDQLHRASASRGSGAGDARRPGHDEGRLA